MPANPQTVARTRERIHTAALSLFTRQGFHGTGMRQIASQAEVSLGNVYNHHKNKEELFAALLEHYEAEYTAPDTPLAKAMANFSGLDDLEKIGRASRATVERFGDYIRLIYVDVVELEGEHIRRLFGGMRKRYQELLGERLDAMRERGELADDVDPIAALMTATISYFYLFNIQQIFGVDKLYGMSDSKAIKTIADVFRKGLDPPMNRSPKTLRAGVVLFVLSLALHTNVTLAAPNGMGTVGPGQTHSAPAPAPVVALAASPEGDAVLAGDTEGVVTRWKVGAVLNASPAGKLRGAVRAAHWSRLGAFVASDEGEIAVVTTQASVIATHAGGVYTLACGPKQEVLISGGGDGALCFWSPQGELLGTIEAHEGPVTGVVVQPGKSPRLWSVGWDGKLRAWRWPRLRTPSAKGAWGGKGARGANKGGARESRATRTRGKQSGASRAGARRGQGRARAASKRKLDKPLKRLSLGDRELTGLCLANAEAKEPVLVVSTYAGELERVRLTKRKPVLLKTSLREHAEWAFSLSAHGRRAVAAGHSESALLVLDLNHPEAAATKLAQNKPPAVLAFLSARELVVGGFDGQVTRVRLSALEGEK